VDCVDSSGGGSLDSTRPPGCRSADHDKYKVTDDGDMKARTIWRENRALPDKAATGLAQEKHYEKYYEKYFAFWFARI
jgi:hypothetical protein